MKRKGLATVVGVFVLLAACAPAAEPTATGSAATLPTGAPTAQPTLAPTRAPLATSALPTGAPTAQPTLAPTRAPLATSAPIRGATPSAGPAGTVKIPVKADPPSWDPIVRIAENVVTKSLVMSRLFTLWPYPPTPDCQDKFQPWLVEKWRWLDDVTAEFTLRQGVRFHNRPPVGGREVVAQDIAFNIDRYRGAQVMAPLLERVKSVEVLDKRTFRIKLAFPWVGLPLEVFAQEAAIYVMAPEAGGSSGELWEKPEKSWIGTGAFMFQGWQPGVKWWLSRNPDYWREEGTPYIAAVEYLVMPDASTRLAAMRVGMVNLLWRETHQTVTELRRTNPDLQAFACPGSSTEPGALYFNTTGPPFNDVRVRRAVSMAIDRKTIADKIHGGGAEIAPFLPSSALYAITMEDLPPEVRRYVEYDPGRARQLLAETGYPQGFKTQLGTSNRYLAQNFRAVMEAVGAMLKEVGIEVKLNFMEHGRFLETVVRGKYPVGEMGVTPSGFVETPENVFGLAINTRYAGSYNRSLINDPEYEKLYDEFFVAKDEGRRKELARQMQILHVDQAYRVTLPLITEYLIVRPDLRIPGIKTFGREMSGLLETVRFAQ